MRAHEPCWHTCSSVWMTAYKRDGGEHARMQLSPAELQAQVRGAKSLETRCRPRYAALASLPRRHLLHQDTCNRRASAADLSCA